MKKHTEVYLRQRARRLAHLYNRKKKEDKAWFPRNQNQAKHVVWQTLIVIRHQLNKALGCRLRQGDFEFLSKAIMKKLYSGKAVEAVR